MNIRFNAPYYKRTNFPKEDSDYALAQVMITHHSPTLQVYFNYKGKIEKKKEPLEYISSCVSEEEREISMKVDLKLD